MKTEIDKATVIVKVEHDQFAENPCEDSDWQVYSFHRNHVDHVSPNILDNIEKGEMAGELLDKADRGLAYWLSFYSHSGSKWSIDCRRHISCWDTAPRAGLLVWEGPEQTGTVNEDWIKDWEKKALAFIEVYNSWCNGNTYNIEISEPITTCVTCNRDYEPRIDHSIGGFYGRDSVRAFLKYEYDIPEEDVEFLQPFKAQDPARTFKNAENPSPGLNMQATLSELLQMECGSYCCDNPEEADMIAKEILDFLRQLPQT